MSQNDSVLPPGTRIDQYEIISLLGQGGFGITYLVRDDALQKEFALKEFFPEDLVRRDGTALRFANKTNSENDYRWGLRKFFDEARLLAQFNHPNIVSVRRVFEANNSAYMLLDFIKGSTLEKWLQGLDSPPTQEELDLITGPLLSALELVHENRSWHLDVSPENIMIRSTDGAPILLDFGASRFEIKQHSQLVSALVFKSGYSAPEQYTSNADRYGPWTDIYATGATLYRAISGSRPTEATSRQLSDDLKPAAQAAKGRYRDKFLKAIDAALRLPPQSRPQTMTEWRQSLLSGTPGASASPSLMTRVIPSARAVEKTALIVKQAPGRFWKAAEDAPFYRRPLGKSLIGLVGLFMIGAGVDQMSPDVAFNPYTYLKTAVRNIGISPSHCSSMFSRSSCWGVVVEKNGSIFARVEEPSKEEAETAAMRLCEQRGGRAGCNVLAVMQKKECWALAEVPNKPSNWRGGSGQSLKEATNAATLNCERNYGYCRVSLTACADGTKADGS
jgi:serine/threonine protein kinase